MSLTGSLYQVTNDELKSLIDNDFDSLEKLSQSVDLSYFAIDFLEILFKYADIDKNSVERILQGNDSFDPDDGFIGYSTSEEVKTDKSEILDKISSDLFAEYLEKGASENNPHTPIQNRDFLLIYFNNIKEAYENAVNENKAIIFRIG